MILHSMTLIPGKISISHVERTFMNSIILVFHDVITSERMNTPHQ